MSRHGVPTARFQTCDSADQALGIVRAGELGWPVVLKADGLAAGKGVVVAEDLATAEDAIVRDDGGAAVRRRRRSARH